MTDDKPGFDVRTDGPIVVRKGPEHGPAVVVLDPHGDAKHDRLPATWRPLAEDVRISWWRLPAVARSGLPGHVLPAELADVAPAHLVAAGNAALLAVSLAAECPGEVRSTILVDPPWEIEVSSLRHTVDYDVVITRSDPADDGLPLGHPDVVTAVVAALLSADMWPGPGNGAAPVLPGAESLASDAWEAARSGLGRVWDSLLGRD